MTTERRYDIDWLRVIAIGLLLIYHISIVFQPWAMFIGFIKNNETIEHLWKAMSLVNIWRIPLLFYVSGIGLYFALQKRTWKQLLIERSKRILLPFLFGIIAITPLHMYVFQTYYHIPLNYYPHFGHLWFLGNIFTYVVLLLPLFIYLKKIEDGKFRKQLSRFMNHPFGPLLISAFFIIETVIVKPQIFEMYSLTWHGFFLGFLAFFFGFLLVYSGKELWKTVLQWRWLYMGVASVLFVIRLFVLENTTPGYLMAIESNCWIFTGLGFSYKYLNKPSTILSYLSQAAYPVYIIHMIALYLGALVILPLDIHPILKFISVLIFTTCFCYIIYEYVIRRVNFLRPLFGLKQINID